MITSSVKTNVYQFPYTRLSNPKEHELAKFKFMPFLKIGIMRDSRVAKINFAYIDTGAQWCLFNNWYAKQIGIQDYKASPWQPVEITGIAGRGKHKEHINPAYFHPVKLIVYKDPKHLKLKNAWVIDTEVGFLEKDFGLGAILGVRGFLDQFSFKANIPEGYFELTPLFEAI